MTQQGVQEQVGCLGRAVRMASLRVALRRRVPQPVTPAEQTCSPLAAEHERLLPRAALDACLQAVDLALWEMEADQ